MEHKKYTTTQVELNGTIVTEIEQEAQALLNLDTRLIKWYGLRRGDILVFRTVEVTATVEAVPEHRYGFTGQIRERTTCKRERQIPRPKQEDETETGGQEGCPQVNRQVLRCS